ncbi:MAG TPA: hypothetical protein PLK08_08675 [Phycisphaerae bacterium]|nr:hypothetical protein [Phycisphaerae bacterium]
MKRNDWWIITKVRVNHAVTTGNFLSRDDARTYARHLSGYSTVEVLNTAAFRRKYPRMAAERGLFAEQPQSIQKKTKAAPTLFPRACC